MSKQALILALSLAVLAPGVLTAEVPAPKTPPIAGLPFSAFLSEDEIRLLFDYMRDATLAAMKGEHYPMPPELAHALDRVRGRLMRQGNAAARQMMEQLQDALDRALEEMRPPAPEPGVQGIRS